MATRSTPFHPAQSPQTNLDTFSITPSGVNQPSNPDKSYHSNLNRQKSDPRLNETASNHHQVRPGQNHQHPQTTKAHQQQYQSHPSPRMVPNPEMEDAIFYLYGEMRSMLDKMGNLMNVYMSQTRPSGYYDPLPTYSNPSNTYSVQHHRRENSHLPSSATQSHIPLPIHPTSQSQSLSGFSELHQHPTGSNRVFVGNPDHGSGGKSDHDQNQLHTPQPIHNSSDNLSHLPSSRHQSRISQPITKFTPDFGDVEDDVVDGPSPNQPPLQHSQHSRYSPPQPPSSRISNVGESQHRPSPPNSGSEHSPPLSRIDCMNSSTVPSINNPRSNCARLDGRENNSNNFNNDDDDDDDGDGDEHDTRRQHEIRLEALYNQTNGIPLDPSLPLAHDNDNASMSSIIDIAFLAHHAKVNFNGGTPLPPANLGQISSNPTSPSPLAPVQQSAPPKQPNAHNIAAVATSTNPILGTNSAHIEPSTVENNNSYDSTASLPHDDDDDFFTMLMRHNSRDPPQLLSDYNVSKNVTSVYPLPPKKPHQTPHPMQSPTCPERSPLEFLTPPPELPRNSAITPSLFQDSRRFNPQQNISEIEFSRIEPVLANLRLCNPRPFPDDHHSSSGLSARSPSDSPSESKATTTGGDTKPDVVASHPVGHSHDDHDRTTTLPTISAVTSTSSHTLPPTGPAIATNTTSTSTALQPPTTIRHNTLLPVATIPAVVSAMPSLSPLQPKSNETKPEQHSESSKTNHVPAHAQTNQNNPTSSTNATEPTATSSGAPSTAAAAAATTTATASTSATTASHQSGQNGQQYSPEAGGILSPVATSSLSLKTHSLLPKRRWDRIRIGIDVGGTLAKICYFAPHNPIPSEILLKQRLDSYLIAHHPHHTQIQSPVPQPSHPSQHHANAQQQGTLSARRAQELEINSEVLHGTLHFVKFQTTSIKHFFDLVNLEGLGRVELFATGGGAHKYRQDFLQMVSAKTHGIPIDIIHGTNTGAGTGTGTSTTNNQTSTDPIASSSNDSNDPTVPNPEHLFHVVDEMSALVRGVAFLIKHSPTAECFSFKRYLFHQELEMYTRSPPAFPFLLVNIGSGVSILRVDNEREYMRVGGSSLGGGTFFGLCRALTGCSSFQEALSLAHRGKGSKVDLLVNDIYGRDYSSLGLSGDTIAASFGKLVKMVDDLPYSSHPHGTSSSANSGGAGAGAGAGGNSQRKNAYDHDNFNPYDYGITREDLAKSALVMITNNICSLAHLYARQVLKVPSVVFVGNFLRNNILAMRMLSYALAYWSNNSIEAIFLKHEGYFGSVGTFFDDEDALSNMDM